jgi:hypothetical protein
VCNPDWQAVFSNFATDLEQASGVGGKNRSGLSGLDMPMFAGRQTLRHLRLSEIVRSRRTTTDFRLFQRDELDLGDHFEQVARLSSDLLGMT